MTCYARPDKRPDGKYYGFHHCEVWCANAKQASDWMCLRLGFRRIAYRGLETGSRSVVTHVIEQGNIRMSYTSALTPAAARDSETGIGAFIGEHGDAVRDVAFLVDDCAGIWRRAVDAGAKSLLAPTRYDDENGAVMMARIATYGDCVHSLIENVSYKGPFLPGFVAVPRDSADCGDLPALLPSVGLLECDHVVGNQPADAMTPVAEWYSSVLDFHQFWSVDDTQVHTEYSALRSIVMCDFDRVVKMPINEPAAGKRTSQIQEYVDYHGGAGVQHIALRTRDIIGAVTALKARGTQFLSIPSAYYADLRKRLRASRVRVTEDLDKIEALSILVDFDDKGYLLQIFTKPVEDRPTLFYEVIQRQNHDGFGAGNFKALFESIEIEQAKRGNLLETEIADAAEKAAGAAKAAHYAGVNPAMRAKL
jgi:4-hydroxyphenylpyruvate dioxygenase